MGLEFEFDRFDDALKFGKNVARNLQATSVHEHRGNKHFIVIPEKHFSKLAASTLAVSIVAAGLMSGKHYLDEQKFAMIINAMQRANPQLAGLTGSEIGAYLSNLTHDQMQGVLSNTKGVYHELVHVETYNTSSLETEAAVHPDLINSGSDVTFTTNGESIHEIQLKAIDEIVDKLQELESSDLSNTELENDVTDILDELISIIDTTDMASEAVSTTVIEEITGISPLSIVTGLLFGIF